MLHSTIHSFIKSYGFKYVTLQQLKTENDPF